MDKVFNITSRTQGFYVNVPIHSIPPYLVMIDQLASGCKFPDKNQYCE